MQEKHVRSLDEFVEFIKEETRKARGEAMARVNDLSKNSVACVDPLSRKKAWNPPGGGMFLANEGYLDEYMRLRLGKDGELSVHRECGYMFVEMRLTTLAAQNEAIERFKQLVEERNSNFNTRFTVSVDDHGLAKPYMRS